MSNKRHTLRLGLSNVLYWITALVVAFSIGMPGGSFAQTGTYFNVRDDQYRLLGLKRAKDAYDYAKAEYERVKSLYDKGLSAQVDLDDASATLSDAQVNYYQSLLALLFERQYVTVTSAVKYYASDGSKHVKLTIANASTGGAEYQKLLNIEDELFKSLQPGIVHDVYVSLLNRDNAIVSKPYETKIDELEHKRPVTLDLKMIQDLDAVTVSLIYGSGTERRMRIYLEKDTSTNRLAVQAEQFSQEADLGSSATFGLGLELYSGTSNTFSLTVVNLPIEISHMFTDPSSGARLSQVKFTESTRSKRVSLKVTLPERPGATIVTDEPIQFFVLALPPNLSIAQSSNEGPWTVDSLDAMGIGYAKLELIPRGKGILRVRANQLFEAIRPDDSAHMMIELVNEGSDRINNIQYEFDMPIDWRKHASPPEITDLGPYQDTTVRFAFVPPSDIAPGRYEVRVRTTGESNGRPVSTEDKTFIIEIKVATSILQTVVIAVLLVGLVI